MRKRAEIEAYRPDMDRTPQHVYEEWVRNATLFEILLDIRDQNERIITLLQNPRTPTRMDIEIMKYIQDPTDMAYAELMEKLTKAGQSHA